MIDAWAYALGSVTLVSLVSLVGVVFLFLGFDLGESQLLYLVSFSVGGLLGGAFLHLVPEAYEEYPAGAVSLYIILGVFCSFMLEMFLQWRHCHIPTSDKYPHSFAYVNLVGDGVHNLIDGLIVGGAYLSSVRLGVTATVAIILHEIPQEIGDFGVLLYAGFKPRRALLFNLASALTAVIGAVLALTLYEYVKGLTGFLVPFAAGNFVYIAGSDLVPKLQDVKDVRRSLVQLSLMCLGVLLMYAVKLV